jgi:hypothetical protein
VSTPSVSQPDVSTAEWGPERGPHDASGPEGASLKRKLARRAVTQGTAAAALTAAGLAGGVVLESQTKLSRKLPVLRRPSRAQSVRGAIAKRLP